MALIWAGYGLAGAYWAQYWISERPAPETWRLAVYLLGAGLVVPLAHVVLDRMRVLPRPGPWVLAIAPAIAALVWVGWTIADPNPMRVVLPIILWLLLWVMRRLGQRQEPVSLGQPVPVWQHLLSLIAPALVVAVAPLGWAQGWGPLEANWVVAGLTIVGSVLWLARLVWSAAQRAKRG
jgi:hypothetical protein